MKKNHYLLLLVLALSSTVNAQTNWITKNLDEKLSVKFPGKPEALTKIGTVLYVYKEKDSSAYSASVVDLNVLAHLDSATLSPMKDTQEFANQLKAGIAVQKTNYMFGDIVVGKWKTYTSYNVSALDRADKNTLKMVMILIGSKMYSFSCRVPPNLNPDSDQTFFSSVELLK